MSATYDKNDREIRVGDILKVFHFVGRRGKHHFMYKQVVGEETLGQNTSSPMEYLQVSHLNMKTFGESDGGYHLPKDGKLLGDYEIVQGLDAEAIKKRPKSGDA